MTRPTLTRRQRDILTYIEGYVTANGYPPSVREIGTVVDLTSLSSVAHQLRQLTLKGYIERPYGIPRAIRLVP